MGIFSRSTRKILMDVKFVSPFVVIGLEGVVGMITITVGTIIYCLIYINSCDFFNKYGEYFIRMCIQLQK